jgi:hypothetical protein
MNISPRRPLRQESTQKHEKSKTNFEKHLKKVHKFIFAPVQLKIWIYLSALILFSLLKEIDYVPSSYFQSKKNILNVYFVKFGWGWTLAVMIPFIILTSQLYIDENSYKRLGKNILRLTVSTLFWWLWTSIFEYIDHQTGECESENFLTKRECRANENDWINSIDISGHTFLLIHSLLFITEEIKLFTQWIRNQRAQSRNSNRIIKTYLSYNLILIGILAFVWEIMLISTFLYFHTLLHKILAAIVAIFSWYFSYNHFYKRVQLNH